MNEKTFSFTPRFPLAAIWEVTQQCNLQCVHCSSSGGGERAPGELSTADALHLVDELAASLHVYRLVISGGEPLLRKDVFTIMRKATAVGLKLSLFTNGTLLTDSVLDLLNDIGIDYLQVGVFTADRLYGISQLNLAHRLFETVKKAKNFNFKIGISIPIHHQTFNEVLSMVDAFLELQPDSLCLSRFVPAGRGTLFAEELLLSQAERRTLALLGQRLREEGHTIILDEPLTDPHGCQAGISVCGISSAGELYPCPLLRLSLGNVNSSSTAELWQKSELIKNLKKRALKGRCGECTIKQQCGGCRGLAFSLRGDCLAEDPQCWRTGSHNTENSF